MARSRRRSCALAAAGRTSVQRDDTHRAFPCHRTLPEAARQRIGEAARHAPHEQFALSPPCGFSSTVHGNAIAMAAQAARLRVVVEVAREVWGGA